MKNKVKEFIEKVITMSKESGLSISHEDIYGSFIIESYDEECSDWLRDAEVSKE
jgi:hypothetical protein